jgi:hypothetical protein
MVGAININSLSGDTLEAYKAAAAALGSSTSSASPSTSKSSSVSTTSPLTATSSPTATSTNQGSGLTTSSVQSTGTGSPLVSIAKTSTKALSGGLIAGIVLGTAVIILAACGLWILWNRTRLLQRRLQPNLLPAGSETREPQEVIKIQELETRERPLELAGSGDGPIYELSDHEIRKWNILD